MQKEKIIKTNGVYRPIIPRGKMYDYEEMRKVALEIIGSKFNYAFRTKQLADEVLARKLNCGIRDIFFDDSLADTRRKLSYRLSQLMREFVGEGIVEKFSDIKSNCFWRIL